MSTHGCIEHKHTPKYTTEEKGQAHELDSITITRSTCTTAGDCTWVLGKIQSNTFDQDWNVYYQFAMVLIIGQLHIYPSDTQG